MIVFSYHVWFMVSLGQTAMQQTFFASGAALVLYIIYETLRVLLTGLVQGTLQKGASYELLINDHFPVEVSKCQNSELYRKEH